RRGRAWATGEGNLAATLLAVTDRRPAEAAQVAFVAALAVADVFETWAPAAVVSIKWPNDVLLAGRKASGILIESGPTPDGRLWLAIGCGLNLGYAPDDTERPATRLADHLSGDVAACPTPDQAMEAFRAAFARRLADWEASGFTAVLTAWTAKAQGLGQACVARLGNETIEGIAEGLEPDGALRLRTASGELRRVTAGDVFFAAA
ncbi:biotin--[acetyl-CoA-carboxylase] ligase, partial [Caulobacter sp. 17J65-9]|uniref:biotin--[acetyl-CoA-carboxylase] ligase n=1 Tax=Caulobacter sp. 17J65-9 TaxID=2709382 RepID=UPI0013CD8849